MRRPRLLLCAGLVLVSSCASAPSGGRHFSAESRSWERLLRDAGFSRDDLHFHEPTLATLSSDAGELTYFRPYHREPRQIPTYARLLRETLAERAPRLASLAETAAGYLGEGSRRQALGDPLQSLQAASAQPGALVGALQSLHADAHAPLSVGRLRRLREQVSAVPPEVQAAAAFLIEASRPAIRAYRLESASLGGRPALDAVVRQITWDVERAKLDVFPVPAAVETALARFDFKRAFAPSLDLVEAASRAEAALRGKVSEKFQFAWDTPYGRVALRGSQDDRYAGDHPYLLQLDTGGQDTYFGGASAYGPDNPVSVLIDLGGDDHYLGASSLRQMSVAEWPDRAGRSAGLEFGAGVFGAAILIDAQGHDVYRMASDGLGRAIFGLGVLADRGGDDQYDCFANCEAAADFGVALLVDGAGRDRYATFTQAQGFGGPHGVGLLLDAGSEPDDYTANDSVRDLPFKRGTDHNVSIAQGAGVGWRGDVADGHSLAGGIGILWDGGGDNRFRAGIHAQGFGYWHGLGILSAGSGRDDYLGDYYAQGTAAHFAVGVLHDEGGDDRYRAVEYQAMGHGRDVSVGVLVDEAGNDVYEAPPLSLGYGDYHSFGLFWDRQGNDRYVSASGEVLGAVRDEGATQASWASLQPSWGLFLDSDGRDQYAVGRQDVGDGRRWRREITPQSRDRKSEFPPMEFPPARGLGGDY